MTTTLVYDGDCGFCTSSVRWIGRLRLHADVLVPYQEADLAALGLTNEQCHDKLQWVGAQRGSGHEAVARLLLDSGPLWGLAGRLLLVPPLSWLAAGVYRLVSDNRRRLPGGTPACALPLEERPHAS